jgi:hypothetical protein
MTLGVGDLERSACCRPQAPRVSLGNASKVSSVPLEEQGVLVRCNSSGLWPGSNRRATARRCRTPSRRNRQLPRRAASCKASTNARQVAESQQVARHACLSQRTLAQESPGWPPAACGSSPGGATGRPDATSVVLGLPIFSRPAVVSPQFLDRFASPSSKTHQVIGRRHHFEHRPLIVCC